MNLKEKFGVRESKLTALKNKITKLGIDLKLIEEKFIKGSGKGGQKINKTSNAVVLHYPPLDLVVKVQKERQRSLNRFLALRELVEQIEQRISPKSSTKITKWKKVQKQKKRRKRRSKSKEEGSPPALE